MYIDYITCLNSNLYNSDNYFKKCKNYIIKHNLNELINGSK